MRTIRHARPGPGGSTRARGIARGVAWGADQVVPRPCTTAPAGEFLGACEGGLELWLSGGHVYSHPPSGGRGSHVCRLAASNRLLKQDRRTARHVAPGSPTDNRRG